MKGNRIGIIGAGPSGLAAIKACLEEGFKPVAFERTDQLGGTWVYRDVSQTDYPEAGAVYNCLKTNTSKAFFGFTDFPCPKEWSPFVTHRKCLEYFQEYAKHFDLSQYIRFNAEVLKVCPTNDHETTGRWRLKYQSGREYCEEIFDAVMICTGVFARANLPRYPGQDCFKGDISTGSKYRENTKYSDKNVLVVGGGISAGDIATDISNISKQTYISSRNGFYCMPVIDSNGWPSDVFFGTRLIQLLPNWIKTWLSERQSYKKFRCEELGLIIPSKDGPNPTGTILNDNFINHVLCGKILPKPGIRRFTETGVVFNDGSQIEDLDAVMFCTGYHIQVPFLDEVSGTSGQRDLYSMIFPIHLKHSTLALIGFFKNKQVGSPVTVSEMQTRWVAQVWSGNCLLPSTSEMITSVVKRRNKELLKYGRVICRIDALRYTDYIATKLGCYPSLASLLVSDPRLAIHMLISPVVPATYRLIGPHCWKGARDVILNSWDTTFQGTRTKEVKRTVSEFSKMKVCVILFTMVIMVFSYAIVG